MSKIYHYLYEVWKDQSFTIAAQKLYVSQPSLSIFIRNYEKELGIQIFDRSSYPVQLTSAGKVYMDGVQRILAIEQEMEAYIDDNKTLKNGHLTVGAANLFATHLLPVFIGRFSSVYPYINLNFKEMDMQSLQNLILNGELDLILESAEPDAEKFDTCPVFKENILLAVPATDPINDNLKKYSMDVSDIVKNRHHSADIPTVPLQLFKNHSFIILEKGHDTRERIFQACKEYGFNPQIAMVLNQLMTAYTMVNQQIGCTFVSDTLVKMCGPRNKIRFYKIPGDNNWRNVNFIYKKKRYITKAMQAFMNVAISLCKDSNFQPKVYDFT